MNPSHRSTGETPLRVLQSFGTPGPRTNPYFTQLFSSTSDALQMPFSWRTALFGRYDVFHVHFVDVVFLRRSRVKSVVGGILFLALLLRNRLLRIPLVRTMHNTATHEQRSWATRALENLAARWTTLWIRLNPRSAPPTAAPVETILHGDYTEWFARWPAQERHAGRILFFGLIRPYKGVEHLISEFSTIEDPALELRIVGRTGSPATAEHLTALQEKDSRVSLLLDYVDDETLAAEIGQAQLVVLPYLDMHNSGAAILALSLSRPILVPSNPMNTDLAGEVGAEWVQQYSGSLSAGDLVNAVAATGRSDMALGTPDLSGRAWPVIGAEHTAAYRRALAIVSGK